MSTENVSLFIQALSQDDELCKRITDEELSSSSWVLIAADAGYEFSEDDIHQFACQVLENPDLKHEDAMQTLVEAYIDEGELTDDDLANVAGGVKYGFSGSFRFKSSLFKRMQAIGYPRISGRDRIRTIF